MVNYPRKILLGGFCVVAVGFASYVLEPGNGVLPWYKPAGAEQSGSSVFGISENRPNMTPRVDLNSIDPTSNLSVAQVLQAVHDSLQRNDLASAKLLLDALKNKHSDDKQAPPIQENLQVRRGSADSIFPTASNDKPRKADGTFRRFQRATPRLSIKSGPSEVLTMTQSRPRMVPRFFQPTVVNGKPQPSDNVVQDATTTISPTPKMLPQEPRAETAPLTLVTARRLRRRWHQPQTS